MLENNDKVQEGNRKGGGSVLCKYINLSVPFLRTFWAVAYLLPCQVNQLVLAIPCCFDQSTS